ncbi:alpha/beta fold hydrolase [Dechloromonas sp. A34]|uniref:alpha/beta fold hydrolase n=1 Tax=Dechloromonas sp. A34 TaxID=447588 RepID=UPI0022496C52|nr:alpha/beta hydrolase [Dechloromonas sp. A34]
MIEPPVRGRAPVQVRRNPPLNTLDPLRKNNATVVGNREASQSIVFVHGFGTDQSVWQDVAASFMDDYRVVLFDNVGAGKSPPEAFVQHRYLNLDTYATDLLDLCTALQLEDAILVGHSLGGMISILATIRNPEIASRLVLVGASPRYLDDEGYRGGFSKSDLDALYKAVTLNYTEWADSFAPLAMANPEKPFLSEDFAATIKSIPADRALTVLCSIFQSDHRAALGKLDIPTLLIQSQNDIAVPLAVAEYLHRHIKHSRLSVIDATGHFPHVSAPAEVVAAIREFIAA